MTTIERPAVSALAAMLDELDQLRERVRRDGDLLWQRTADWVKIQQPPAGERGGGTSAPADDALRERMLDRMASKYHDELRQLTRRLHDDASRYNRIADIVLPKPAVSVGNHMQAAQVAAEGWCVSCWRNDQTCEPIAKRPSGEPYYRDRCRPCGAWKAEHGQDPPLPILKLRHEGRRVTQRDVDAALRRK